MIPLRWVPKILGAVVTLALLWWGGMTLASHLGKLEGERDAAKQEAKRWRSDALASQAQARAATDAALAAIAESRARVIAAEKRVVIAAPDTVVVDGVPTWTHPAVVGALADCREVVVREIPLVVGAVEAEQLTADNALAASSAVILAYEVDEPGWLRRTWEKVDAPVAFVGGVLVTVAAFALAGGA